MVAPYCIGSDEWNGLSKLIEECGEVLQVAGKIIGAEGKPDHYDGTDLRQRLENEMADLLAALTFVMDINAHHIDAGRICERAGRKLALFEAWDADARKNG